MYELDCECVWEALEKAEGGVFCWYKKLRRLYGAVGVPRWLPFPQGKSRKGAYVSVVAPQFLVFPGAGRPGFNGEKKARNNKERKMARPR
jgi:hypothetical protein